MIQRISLFIFLFTFSLQAIYAQSFKGELTTNFDNSTVLKEHFKKFDVFELDAKSVDSHFQASKGKFDFNLTLNKELNWSFDVVPNDIKTSGYYIRVRTDIGEYDMPFEKVITFLGYNDSGVKARLTINDEFFYGLIEDGENTFFIEPLHYFEPEADRKLFVIYEQKDVNVIEGRTCGADEMVNKTKEIDSQIHDHQHEYAGKMACYEVDVRLAGDWSMNVKKGGVSATVNWMTGVLNNVATNYDDEFSNELLLFTGSSFVTATSGGDPWTGSTNASTLLSSFTSWGQGGGFGTTDFEVATLWTDRDLNGGTIGIAWVGAVCTNSKYNVCEDYGGGASQLRVLQAHEIGHNFDANHDASGAPFIMAPSVNTATSWSGASIAAIDNYTNFVAANGCFGPCTGGGGPIADFTSNVSNPTCQGSSVFFTDLSAGNPTNWSWSFPGGAPNSSSQPNPTITYNVAGNYSVTLTVSNSSGTDTYTETSYIEVPGTAFANFNPIVQDLTVEFDNTSSNATTYDWDFGDGNTSTQYSPTHTYAAPGTYSVTLLADNGCSVNGNTKSVTVTLPVPSPVASFYSDHTNPTCSGITIQFTDDSSNSPDSWNWNFPGGIPNSSTDQNPIVTYPTPGQFDVSLIVSNTAGFDSHIENNFVFVGPDAIADFSFTSNNINSSATFTNLSLDADAYFWDFGDGNTSSDENPVHIYGTSGTFTVTLEAINSCGSNFFQDDVIIDPGPPPNADFFSTHSNPICNGVTVNFTDATTFNPTTWLWDFPGGNPSTSTEQNPIVVYDTPGNYDVTLSVSSPNGSDSETEFDYVVVIGSPNVDFTSAANGLTVNYTNTTTNGSNYTWDFGDGNNSSDQNPSHTYASGGTYTVVLSSTNTCGTDTETKQVVVTPPIPAPVTDFTSNHTNPICGGTVVNFTDNSTNSPTSWSWTFEGGTPATSTDQNPIVTFNLPGTYEVSLTATNGTGSNTKTNASHVVVGPNAVSNFDFVNNALEVTFTNTSTNANSYSWDFGDGNTSVMMSPVHTYQSGGTFNVNLTATNSCGSNTSMKSVTVVPMPVANFTSNHSNPICGGTSVAFIDSSTGSPASWNWTFQGGTPGTSTDQNPTVTFSNPGTYNVTLEVTNVSGTNTKIENGFVVITQQATSDYTFVQNDLNVVFTNTSQNATSFNWTYGDGNTSIDQNPNYTYATAGTYAVVLNSSNQCGTASVTKNISVTEPIVPPTTDFTSNHSNPVCGGQAITFTDNSSNSPNSWSWSFPGGTPSSSTQQNPTVTYTNPGTYEVMLTATNSAGSNTKTTAGYVVVSENAVSNFGYSANALEFTFNNNSTNSTSYFWNFGDGNSSVATTPVHTYTMSGTFTVSLVATNSCGSNTSTQVINAIPRPVADFTANHVNPICSGTNVEFADISSGSPTSWSWSFPGANPASSTNPNPQVVYPNPGFYEVSLTVTNASGTDTKTISNFIQVSENPTAAFSFVENNFDVSFTNNSTNATSYQWNFGDGNSSIMENPTNTYGTAGTYQVELIATSQCGSNSITQTVNAREPVPPPTSDFVIINTGALCAGGIIGFSDMSTENPTSWSWEFPGASPATSNQQNPSVVYASAGSYDVTLTVTNSAGTDTKMVSSFVVINDVPTIDFAFNVDEFEVTFSNNSTNADSFSWDFGDGNSSTDENPTYSYLRDGDFEVALSATNECGTTTENSIVTIIRTPVPPVGDFTSDAGNSICQDDFVQFSDLSSGNPTSWSWEFPGGTPASSTDQNPSVQYDTPGTYDAILTVTNIDGTDTKTLSGLINVSPKPIANFDFSTDELNVTFENLSQFGDSYSWDFGDGRMSTDENPVYTYGDEGSYEVVLSVTNNCGTTIQTLNVAVTRAMSPPISNFNLENLGTICEGTEVVFTDASAGAPTTWEWTFEGGTPANSTDQNPIIIYDTPGTYDVSLRVVNSGGEDTKMVENFITVAAEPTAAFTNNAANLEVTFQNTSQNGSTYSWDFGDGNLSSDENPVYTFGGSGTYEISLTVTNDCGTNTFTEMVEVMGSSSTDNLDEISELSIYPNPNNGQFSIQIKGEPSEFLGIKVLNSLGQVFFLEKERFDSGFLKKELDLNLSDGLYYIQIQRNNDTILRKIEIH